MPVVAVADGAVEGFAVRDADAPWPLARALADLARWQRRTPAAAPRVHLEVPLERFTARLAGEVATALATAGADPSGLVLEVDERAVLADEPGALSVLRRLRAAGVRTALAGFGSCGGTVTLLRALPVDGIVLLPDLVGRLTTERQAESFALAAASVAQAFGRRVHARGVSTSAQLRRVCALGVDLAEGPRLLAALAPPGADLATPAHR